MDRIPTGIPGMDDLIEGGFPAKTVNLISGPAGSAKTLFGLQYIYNGAVDYGEPGIYLTLEESRDNLLRAAKCYGIDMEPLEKSGHIFLLDLGKMRAESSTKEELEWGLVSFETLQDFLKNHLNFSKAKRIVVDSVTAVGLYYSSVEQLRREMFRFSRFLKEMEITSLLITETNQGELTRYGIEQFIADSLIVLGYEQVGGEFRRSVAVHKMRFTRHDGVRHPFLIFNQGIEISPDECIS